jgi:hypothetical protein
MARTNLSGIVLAVAVAMAGCGGEDCPPTLADGVANLYAIEGDAVTCNGAALREFDADRVLCGWDCVEIHGRAARHLYLNFGRAGAAWALETVSVEWGECEEH